MVTGVPESFSELRIGVLTIFAEAQAWARELRDGEDNKAAARRAARAGEIRAQDNARSSEPGRVTMREIYAKSARRRERDRARYLRNKARIAA